MVAGWPQRWAAAMVFWILGLTTASPFALLVAASPAKACCRTKGQHKCCRAAKPGEVTVTAPKPCASSCCSAFALSGSRAADVAADAPRLGAPLRLSASVPAAAERAIAALAQSVQFERPPPVLL